MPYLPYPLVLYLIGYICAFLMLIHFAASRNAKGKAKKTDYVIVGVLSLLSWIWAIVLFIAWLDRTSRKI